jgi:hypothetical protein
VQFSPYALSAAFGVRLQAVLQAGDLQQRHQLALAFGVAIDVALSGLNRTVAGEQLHVTQAAAGTMQVARCPRDKRAATGVRLAAFNTEVTKHRHEPVDDAVRSHCAAFVGGDDRPIAGLLASQVHQGLVQCGVQRDPTLGRRFAMASSTLKTLPIWPLASTTIDHCNRAISIARNPAFTDKRMMARLRAGSDDWLA